MPKLLLMIIIAALILGSGLPATADIRYEEDWLAFLAANQMVLEDDAENPEARFQLGVAQANLGFVEEALDSFSRFYQDHDRDQSQEMLQNTRQELDKTPGNFLILNQKGFLLFSLQRHEEAEEVFTSLIKEDRQNPWLYNFLALTQMAQIKTEEARKTLYQSLEVESNNYTHALLGQLYWSQGKFFRAWKHFFQTGTLLLSIRQSLQQEVD